jgi:hypothetical protein
VEKAVRMTFAQKFARLTLVKLTADQSVDGGENLLVSISSTFLSKQLFLHADPEGAKK